MLEGGNAGAGGGSAVGLIGRLQGGLHMAKWFARQKYKVSEATRT